MPKKIKPAPTDAKEIFRHAIDVWGGTQYLVAAAITLRRRDLIASSTILAPFTCELLLKCLQRIEGRTRIDGHMLDALFRVLTPNTKARIKALWNERARPNVMKMAASFKAQGFDKQSDVKFHFELEEALFHNRDIFDAVRYSYEFKRAGNVMLELPSILIAVILEMKPEWNSPSANAPT